MSHITHIKTQMVNKEFLLKAIQDLGYAFEEGPQEINGIGDTKSQVEIKIPMRLSSDIGFCLTSQGYEVVADWWSVRGVKREAFTNQLLQRYAYHATLSKLEEQGFTLVEEKSTKTGQLRLVLRRSA